MRELLKILGFNPKIKLFVDGRQVVGPQDLLDSIGVGWGKVSITTKGRIDVSSQLKIGVITKLKVTRSSINNVPYSDMEFAE